MWLSNLQKVEKITFFAVLNQEILDLALHPYPHQNYYYYYSLAHFLFSHKVSAKSINKQTNEPTKPILLAPSN